MFFNFVKGEVLQSKTWEDVVTKNNVYYRYARQRILVKRENGKEDFFEGPLIDAIDFSPGQIAIIGWGSTHQETGSVMYAENLNTRISKSAAITKLMGWFGLSFWWLVWIICVFLCMCFIEISLTKTNEGNVHMSTVGSIILLSLSGYSAFILFWQMVKWNRENIVKTIKEFNIVALEAGKEIGIEFNPRSFYEECGYSLVKVH